MGQAYIISPAEAMSEHISRIIGPDNIGDGAGIMTSIPFELFNREPDTFAVAFLFIPQDLTKQKQSLQVFENLKYLIKIFRIQLKSFGFY